MKKRLSKQQSVCVTLLWVALCYIVLTSTPLIDGPVIVTLLMSAAFVFIPVYKSLKNKKQ